MKARTTIRWEGAERERSLSKAWTVGPAALGIAARRGVDPEIVHADPVTLLVVLASAVLVQQVEGRRHVVVQDEQRVQRSLPFIARSRTTMVRMGFAMPAIAVLVSATSISLALAPL